MFCSPGSGLLIIHIDVAVRHFGGACLGAEAQILSGNIRDSHICGGSALRGQLAREGDRKRDLTLYFVGGGGHKSRLQYGEQMVQSHNMLELLQAT